MCLYYFFFPRKVLLHNQTKAEFSQEISLRLLEFVLRLLLARMWSWRVQCDALPEEGSSWSHPQIVFPTNIESVNGTYSAGLFSQA